MKSTLSAPQIDVSIWSHRYGRIPLRGITSFTSMKSLHSPSGQWSIGRADDAPSAKDFSLDDIDDDDWITAEIVDAPRSMRTEILAGAVDGTRNVEAMDPSGKSYSSRDTIMGRDFAKFVETGEFLPNAFLASAEPVIPGLVDIASMTSFIDLGPQSVQVEPRIAAARFLQIALGMAGGWIHLPRGLGPRTLGEAVHFDSDVDLGQLTTTTGYNPLSPVRIHQHFASLFGTPFLEIFYDLRPAVFGNRVVPKLAKSVDGAAVKGMPFQGWVPTIQGASWKLVPTIVYRKHPVYQELDFELLETVVDSPARVDGQVSKASLGRSGSERFTMFSSSGPAWATALAQATWGYGEGRIPVFQHEKSSLSPDPARTFAGEIAKHGLRLLDRADNLAPAYRGGGDSPAIDWVVGRARLLYEVYSRIPLCKSGTLNLAVIRPDIRIGTFVIFKGFRYYVEQVEHDVAVNPRSNAVTGSTTLTVTFGRPVEAWMSVPEPTPWLGVRK